MLGIFDSGFGGLTIFKHIARTLPQYDYLYLGDNARAPYGNRSQETIYEFTVEAVDWLFKQGCTLVVLACNTASAEALRKLQQEWLPSHLEEKPPSGGFSSKYRNILGVIRPVVEEAVKMTKGSIGVVGTRATIASGAYTRELKKLKPEATVIEHACPLLVPLIEEEWSGKPEIKRILRSYLRPLQQKVDTLILGCTHYPLLEPVIAQVMGEEVAIVNPARAVAVAVREQLQRDPALASACRGTSRTFHFTDTTPHTKRIASEWLGIPVIAETVELSAVSVVH